MNLRIPKNSLVVMVGVSGSGKTSLAHRLFGHEPVVSTDNCRRLLSGDLSFGHDQHGPIPCHKAEMTQGDDLQKLSEGAFHLFYAWVRARLRHGLLTVADSTALRPEYRNELFRIAVEEHVRVTYLFVDAPFDQCVRNNASRPGHERVAESVVKRQFASLNRSRAWLRSSDNVVTVKPGDEVAVTLTEPALGIDAKAIDVIGDVHGCLDELVELVEKLGYLRVKSVPSSMDATPDAANCQDFYRHPDGRKLVFVGDLIDRGPEPYKVLDFVRRHVQAGLAELVLSNHERKLRNYLSGRNVMVKPDFQRTIDSIPKDVDKNGLKAFLYSLRPYRSWTAPDGQPYVVVHAAFDPKFEGKMDQKIEEYCVYGPTNGVDPVTRVPDRIDWWKTYRPGPRVVYGHIVTDDGQPRVYNQTYGIDTGCVHGGSLTALRLPEGEFVQVKARQAYYESSRQAGQEDKDAKGTCNLQILIDRRVTVRGLDGGQQDVFLRDRGLMDAIDALSGRTVRPDKLVWLAPTMSPGPVSEDPSRMEDPVTVAKWMLANAPAGTALVAQTKHMGSRGTWLCERHDGRWEITCWTRNGYEMFDGARRAAVYDAVQPGLDALATALGAKDVLLLDTEVMPFNQHGDEWLERVFMQTAAAGKVSRFAMARACKQAGLDQLAERYVERMDNLGKYAKAAAQFCWPVNAATDVRIGVFDVLFPFQTGTHGDLIEKVNDALAPWSVFRPTTCLRVEGPKDFEGLQSWFDDITTNREIEGVVLKYDDRSTFSATKFPQQALKVRGRDYLRIVYGPQYLDPQILPKLRAERRVETKQRMAYQQALLGREALRRNFGEGRPFEAWHECILSILAADKATVDPRL